MAGKLVPVLFFLFVFPFAFDGGHPSSGSPINQPMEMTDVAIVDEDVDFFELIICQSNSPLVFEFDQIQKQPTPRCLQRRGKVFSGSGYRSNA